MTGSNDDLRAAAIARVTELREYHAGRIPRESLMEGVTIDGQRIPIWNDQNGIFKPAALGRGGAALSIQTSIDPDARVHVREDILREKDGPMLRHRLQEMAGSRLILPRSGELRPNRDFLAKRFDLFRAA